jgi:hypothetical protein
MYRRPPTLNLQPYTFNLKLETFDLQSGLRLGGSLASETLNLRPSILDFEL